MAQDGSKVSFLSNVLIVEELVIMLQSVLIEKHTKRGRKQQEGIRIILGLNRVSILMKIVMGYLIVRKNVNKTLDFS